MENTAKSAGKLTILYGEGDAEVLSAQAVSIQKAGHQVQTAEGRKGVLEALKTGKFDLVLIGSSMNRDDRHHLPYMVKKSQAATRILVMHADGARHPAVDGNVDTGTSMESLLEKIAGLMGKSAKAAGAGR
jgi:DNA-binding NtrC family response regulator